MRPTTSLGSCGVIGNYFLCSKVGCRAQRHFAVRSGDIPHIGIRELQAAGERSEWVSFFCSHMACDGAHVSVNVRLVANPVVCQLRCCGRSKSVAFVWLLPPWNPAAPARRSGWA